jgi:hypothetical protein
MNWWVITILVVAAANILYGFLRTTNGLTSGVSVFTIVINVIIWLVIVGLLRAIWLGLRHLGRRRKP